MKNTIEKLNNIIESAEKELLFSSAAKGFIQEIKSLVTELISKISKPDKSVTLKKSAKVK